MDCRTLAYIQASRPLRYFPSFGVVASFLWIVITTLIVLKNQAALLIAVMRCLECHVHLHSGRLWYLISPMYRWFSSVSPVFHFSSDLEFRQAWVLSGDASIVRQLFGIRNFFLYSVFGLILNIKSWKTAYYLKTEMYLFQYLNSVESYDD